MHSIFGFVEHNRMGAVQDGICHFFVPVGGQAMHEHRILGGLGHQRFIHLISREQRMAAGFLGVSVMHRKPGVGDHTVSITSNGFQTRTLTIRTTAGYKLIANLKLALISGGIAPETTTTATASASVVPAKTKAATQSAAQQPEPAKPYVVIKDTPTGFLRVRMEPATSATEAGRVNPGERYSIVSSENGWYEIKYDGTNTGWVSGQYTQKVE